MADEEQDELMVAEPRECSRWAMAFFLGCIGVLLFPISCFLIRKSARNDDGTTALMAYAVFDLGFILHFLSFFFLALCGIVLIECCSNRLDYEGQKRVDKLLLL
jgi:hypothetical protein